MNKSAKKSRKKNTSDPDAFYKFFNLKKVSESLEIQHDKVYNNFKGRYASFSDADKKNIALLMSPQVEKLFKHLGYSVSISRD